MKEIEQIQKFAETLASPFAAKENTEWFSPLNTIKLRQTASFWRYCGHVSYKMFHIGDLHFGIFSEFWEASKELGLSILSLLILLLFIISAPISIPILALINQRKNRKNHRNSYVN